MAEVESQPEKSLTNNTDVNGDEDEILVEITEDQINELLPDDDEEEDDDEALVNESSVLESLAEEEKAENGIEENIIALNIASAVSITPSEFHGTVDEDSTKRKSSTVNKPNKRKRSDPMHIVKATAANQLPVSALLNILRKPVLTEKSAEGFAEIPPPPPYPVPPIMAPKRNITPVDLVNGKPPSNTMYTMNMPTSSSMALSVSQASAATTLQLVASAPLRKILPKTMAPILRSVSPPPIEIPSPVETSLPGEVSPSAPSSPPVVQVPVQKFTAQECYQLSYEGLSPSLPHMKIRVPCDYVWLFRKKPQQERYEPKPPPENLFRTTPTPTPCRACDDIFYTAKGLLFHLRRQCTLISFACSDCSSTISAPNKCAFLNLLASHECTVGSSEICLLDLSVEPICPEIPKQKHPGTVAVSPPTLIAPEPEVVPPEPPEVTEPSVAKCASAMNKAKTKECPECKLPLKGGTLFPHMLGEISSNNNHKMRRCESCFMYLMTPCHYSAHMRIHGMQAPYVCPECGDDDFGSREIFMKHVKKVCLHFNRCLKMTCKHCDREFISQAALSEHLHQRHSPSYYKCCLCPMAFKTTNNFSKHQQQHMTNDGKQCNASIIGKCPSCDKLLRSFNTNVGRIHIMSHSLEQNCKEFKLAFKCMQCKLYYNSKLWLRKHLSSHHPDLIILKNLCKYCGWEAQSEKTLTMHLKLIHREKCKALTTDPVVIEIEEDEEEVNKEEEGEEEEEEEEEKDAAASMESSEEVPPPPEEDCPPASPEEEENPDFAQPWKYECDQCQMVFESMSVFDRHMKKHRFVKRRSRLHFSPEKKEEVSEKPLVAQRTIGSLCTVSVKPTAEQLPCPQCEFTFSTDDDLQQHMQRGHQHERHFSCHLCGVTYTDKATMEAHVKSAHAKKMRTGMIVCCLCQRPCKTLPSLVQHFRTHKVPRSSIDKLINDSLQVKDEEKNSGATRAGKRLRQDGDTLFTCAKCPFSTEDKKLFSAHIQLHRLSKNAIQCSECGLCFAVVPALKRHLLMVHKIRNNIDAMVPEAAATPPLPRECSVALTPVESLIHSSTLTPRSKVKVNKELKEEPGAPSNQCLVCYRSFNDHSDLRKHMRTHGMAFIQSKRALNKAQHS